MNQTENTIQHLSVILDKITKNTPFGLIAFADGEYMIMKNSHFNTQDEWSFNGGTLQHDLLSVKDSKKNLPDFFVGLPCKDCWGIEMVNELKNMLELENSECTYANIFCNKNWKIFTRYLIENETPLYYIGSGNKLDSELNIKEIFKIDPYLVNKWDTEKQAFLDNIDKWIHSMNLDTCKMFVFSAGPISEYIIPILYKKYPNHQFLDVGSSLDIFMKGTTNRSYIHDNQSYSNVVCSFMNGHT